jgi:glycosyltransferase involved in cell wall biosynthesis
MKVLHVIPSVSPRDGGPSRAIADIERALVTRGIEVTTVTTNDARDTNSCAVECGVPIKTAGVTRWYFPRNSTIYKTSFPMASWLRRNIDAFDVVHAHALFSFAPIIAAFIARRAGVPYVLRPLGVLNQYGMTHNHPWFKRLSFAAIERPLLEDAGAVHFTSQAELAHAERLRLSCRAVVIPLGIDQGGAVGKSSPTRSANDTSESHLLFLSRIDPIKNLESLLHAVSCLRTRQPRLILDIVGDGDESYVDELKSLAAKLAISEHVRWHGYLDGQRKDQIIAAATAFVLPSFSESFGVAVVEALAAGLPCIVSSEVAVNQEIKAAGAGIVVGTDIESIAAGIDDLLANKDRYAAFRSAAVTLALGVFSLAVMGERLETLYNEVACGMTQQAVAAC